VFSAMIAAMSSFEGDLVVPQKPTPAARPAPARDLV
jgi:hypothetical protein